MAAYQLGPIRHLPEPALRWLDTDRVDASGEAYEVLKTPDAALGPASLAGTLVLAGRRADRHPSSHPVLSLALGAKVLARHRRAPRAHRRQGTKHRRFCSWCRASAALGVAAVPQVVPEVRAAWRAVRGG